MTAAVQGSRPPGSGAVLILIGLAVALGLPARYWHVALRAVEGRRAPSVWDALNPYWWVSGWRSSSPRC